MLSARWRCVCLRNCFVINIQWESELFFSILFHAIVRPANGIRNRAIENRQRQRHAIVMSVVLFTILPGRGSESVS